ncbi:MAG: hypothetical protein JNK12_20220 [Acidimicrobiales bacterium]|nr:hypothetical protein [Acidimicrobiales bacterium]
MADELDGLLARVDDAALRADLRTHIDRLRSKRSFGLVFESHLPERVRLPEHPVRVGASVALRDDPKSATYEVLGVDAGRAAVRTVRHPDGSRLSPEEQAESVVEAHPVEDLVVISDFGDPIYPGLRRLGSADRGGDKPAHVVVKGENHHVLSALQFTHAGKVDCIYIDPPYNTGARDWKYDNDYVDDTDAYRHSKWLAFMERRLLLAKELLNPAASVLIVTIDEKEYLRLGLLLEQVFPSARTQMVSSVVNRKGVPRKQGFARADEYLFFTFIGDTPPAVHTNDMLSDPRPQPSSGDLVTWVGLRRRGSEWRRSDRPGSFFPLYVDAETGEVVDAGEPLSIDTPRSAVPERAGCLTVWPVNSKGEESRWQLSPANVMRLRSDGFLRSRLQKSGGVTVEYLSDGQRQQIGDGRIVVEGRHESGAVIVRHVGSKVQQAKSVWNLDAHGATAYGTQMIPALLPGRAFPYPKSLYAVEDFPPLLRRRQPRRRRA